MVAVEETAVDENHCPMPGKHHVRPSRQTPNMESEAIPKCMKGFTN
jgi:hypothetical protein